MDVSDMSAEISGQHIKVSQNGIKVNNLFKIAFPSC
jgi:hypothetical protein